MKKIYFFIFLLFAAAVGQAQNSSFSLNKQTITGTVYGSTFWSDTIWCTNLTQGDLFLEWEVTGFSGVNSWNYQICDFGSCIPLPNPYVHEADTLAAQAMDDFKVYIYPDDTLGASSIEVKVWEKDNRSETEETITIDLNSAVSVNPASLDADLEVYPSLATEKVFLRKAGGVLPAGSATLIDLSGKVLSETQVRRSETTEIDVQELPKGIYFIRFQSGEEVVTRKFLKN